MNLTSDPRQPVQQTSGSMEPSRPWSIGLAAVDGDPLAESAQHQDSYLAECECPDDCLRDHGNE